MSPTIPSVKSWKETNRFLKEQRKKWREERLAKKLKKEEVKKKVKEEVQQKVKEEVQEEVQKGVIKSIEQHFEKKDISTIARAACVYKVDEIIVFDDKGEIVESEKRKVRNDEVLGERRIGCLQLARILQYLECPQYLRKYFFPIHTDLQYAGVLNPLDAPHHLRQSDISLYREGVVTNKPVKGGKGSYVNVGLLKDVHVDKVLTPGLRVTVKIPSEQLNSKKLEGFIVSPDAPKSDTGIYWGYNVRLADNLTEVLTQGPYTDGYDLTIGTSDKGKAIDDIEMKSMKYHHAVIVFGGLSGLEAAVDSDTNLNVDDPSLIFDKYLNTCPEQGSRTIRTEEAILITLAELRTKLSPRVPLLSSPQFDAFVDN